MKKVKLFTTLLILFATTSILIASSAPKTYKVAEVNDGKAELVISNAKAKNLLKAASGLKNLQVEKIEVYHDNGLSYLAGWGKDKGTSKTIILELKDYGKDLVLNGTTTTHTCTSSGECDGACYIKKKKYAGGKEKVTGCGCSTQNSGGCNHSVSESTTADVMGILERM